MTYSCTHCSGMKATCCQCNSTKRVTELIASKNLEWLWEWPDCTCQACAQLAMMHLPEPVPDVPAVFDEPIVEVPIPDADGTFRSYFCRQEIAARRKRWREAKARQKRQRVGA